MLSPGGSGAVEKDAGAVKAVLYLALGIRPVAYLGANVIHLISKMSNMEVHNGAVESHQGDVEAHPGVVYTVC
jgi:hypothetical protein